VLATSFPALANTDTSARNPNQFHFRWQEKSGTVHSQDTMGQHNPLKVLGGRQAIDTPNDNATSLLQLNYGIALDNTRRSWSNQQASVLLEVLASIPVSKNVNPSYWALVDEYIEDDIEVEIDDEYTIVWISTAAFDRASTSNASLGKKTGTAFSKRLHHALVHYVTNKGKNQAAYEKILTERFGVSTQVDDYSTLTASTTKEDKNSFQIFHPSEIIEIINTLEEMPKSMHKVAGLKHLVRRLDGTSHPLYGGLPAVAWTDAGYIEFAESAFNTDHNAALRRLVIHEKSHFLWRHVFNTTLTRDWITLGGWHNDKKSQNRWVSTNQTQFVSAYAHQKNPNEHLAESIAHYVLNPALLRSRAMSTFEFVRDRIMQGDIYVSEIRRDLTFMVENLTPDYNIPGRILSVDIQVAGAPTADKTVTILLTLDPGDLVHNGASRAYTRVQSESGTYFDLYLYPVNTAGNRVNVGTQLKGVFHLSKHSKQGYWSTNQIVITDPVGNSRYLSANDFGWKLFVDSPLQDVEAPDYVDGSARLTSAFDMINGKRTQVISAIWKVLDKTEMGGFECYASLNDEYVETYRRESYGHYDTNTQTCTASFDMPEYMPSGQYSLAEIRMSDIALNSRRVTFLQATSKAPKINLQTNNPDFSAPTLDLNHIQLVSEPQDIKSPNGETQVTIKFRVNDDNSGFDLAALRLRDPSGVEHAFRYVRSNMKEIIDGNETTIWQEFTDTVTLPAGSMPGIWGLSELSVRDKAGNFKHNSFTELVHFNVD
jgi:hypothetical protein